MMDREYLIDCILAALLIGVVGGLATLRMART